MDKIPKIENIILAGDFNGRIGNQPIPEWIGTYGEKVTTHEITQQISRKLLRMDVLTSEK